MRYNKYLAQVALGKKQAEVVLKNGEIVNVFTGEIYSGDIAIEDGMIVGIGEYKGIEEVDIKGQVVVPGFIDGHLHFESCMVNPNQLVHYASLQGTTTYIVDPHEVANVSGSDGIQYILDQIQDVSANVYIMLPSCVPATPFEDNGCVYSASQMKELINHPNVLGLGEVMDYMSVIYAEDHMLDKLSLFEGRIKDGHAGFLQDKELAAYVLSGISTDHECCDYETAMQERRNGMHILIREGSAAKNMENIIPKLIENKIDLSGFSYCTDDKHIETIRKEGHINDCIKKGVRLGLTPIESIQMATIHTANCYGLKHVGAIAPGYQADLVILDNLQEMNILKVYHKGRLIDASNKPGGTVCKQELKHTVHIAPISEKDLEIKVGNEKLPVLEVVPKQILTKHRDEVVESKDGLFQPNGIYNKAIVVERHHATGKKGLAIIKGFSITNGAIATTVSHDSHNLIVIGDNDRDILLAMKELERTGGGYTIVEQGAVVDTLELPVMGLISEEECDKVDEKLKRMIAKAHRMGVADDIDPFITMSFIALPVIPEIRITNRGLYSVIQQKFI